MSLTGWKRKAAAVIAGFCLALGLSARPAQAVEVQRVVSPMGIEAWLIEDDTVPLISVAFAFEGAGTAADEDQRLGLANLLSGMLDEGAGEYDSQSFQQMLSDNSISLSFSAGRDDFTGSLKVLNRDREPAFDLLALALTQPRFDAEPLERIRRQVLASLAQADQDPGRVASRAFFRAAFPDHPYGRIKNGTPETVGAITAQDLRRFTAAAFARGNLKIGVTGDIRPDALGVLLDRAFAGLPAQAALAHMPSAAFAASGVQVVDKPIPQAQVIMGHAGLARLDDDFYAAYVANYILGGGGFASRLTEKVREERGLAYSVYSYMVDLRHAPLVLGGVGTDNSRVAESIALIRAEWRRMAENGVSARELEEAKRYLTGSFPLRFTSSDQMARSVLGMQLDRLDIDFLEKRNAHVQAVTREDVARAAARLFKPDALFIVVVGQPQGLGG